MERIVIEKLIYSSNVTKYLKKLKERDRNTYERIVQWLSYIILKPLTNAELHKKFDIKQVGKERYYIANYANHRIIVSFDFKQKILYVVKIIKL